MGGGKFDLNVVIGYLQGFLDGWRFGGNRAAQLTPKFIWNRAPQSIKRSITEEDFNDHAQSFIDYETKK